MIWIYGLQLVIATVLAWVFRRLQRKFHKNKGGTLMIFVARDLPQRTPRCPKCGSEMVCDPTCWTCPQCFTKIHPPKLGAPILRAQDDMRPDPDNTPVDEGFMRAWQKSQR